MSYQEDLILSMYNQGEPGLAMGNIPPGKGGSPGQPYDPPKPTGPYVPAPKRDLAMDDPLADYDVTDKGYFMDYNGDMYMNLDGMLFPMGQGYERGTHGELVPKGLVQSMQINQDVANITPKDLIIIDVSHYYNDCFACQGEGNQNDLWRKDTPEYAANLACEHCEGSGV